MTADTESPGEGEAAVDVYVLTYIYIYSVNKKVLLHLRVLDIITVVCRSLNHQLNLSLFHFGIEFNRRIVYTSI